MEICGLRVGLRLTWCLTDSFAPAVVLGSHFGLARKLMKGTGFGVLLEEEPLIAGQSTALIAFLLFDVYFPPVACLSIASSWARRDSNESAACPAMPVPVLSPAGGS